MANKEAVNKARQLRAQGRTEEQITAALFNMNMSDEEVAQAVTESLQAPSAQTAEQQTKPEKNEKSAKKRWWWPF